MHTTRSYLRHLYTARGSLSELHTQILVANDLEYLRDATATELEEHVHRLRAVLQGQIDALESKTPD